MRLRVLATSRLGTDPDDPDCDVGFVAPVSQDLDAQGRAIEHDGVLMPVK
jgi:hypothetical protein